MINIVWNDHDYDFCPLRSILIQRQHFKDFDREAFFFFMRSISWWLAAAALSASKENFKPARRPWYKKERGRPGSESIYQKSCCEEQVCNKREIKVHWARQKSGILFPCCLIERETINDNLRGDIRTPFTPYQLHFITQIQPVFSAEFPLLGEYVY